MLKPHFFRNPMLLRLCVLLMILCSSQACSYDCSHVITLTSSLGEFSRSQVIGKVMCYPRLRYLMFSIISQRWAMLQVFNFAIYLPLSLTHSMTCIFVVMFIISKKIAYDLLCVSFSDFLS